MENKQEVKDIIVEKMMPYSMSVLISRALPSLEDGFKPSQRKFLATMNNMHLFNQRAKSANIEGQVMKLNPHAGSYEVGVRMTREAETLLTPWIYGKGSFGKHYSSETVAAAPRYSEMQLAPICHELFDNLKKNPDNMIDNYDGTMKEPRFLSAPFPNILANPNLGIAVGFACNFPSFNLKELCDATIEVIKNYNLKEVEIQNKVKKKMPTADFSTGAEILYNEKQIDSIYETGQGAITLRAKFHDDSKNRILEVTEIPYTTTAEAIVDSIIKAYKENKLPEITDVRDEIDKNGFKVAIDYKRGTDVEQLKKKLFALTPLQDNFNVNMNLVYKNTPCKMGVVEILKHWIEHRREWVKIELKYDLKEKEELLHLLQGLEQILLDIDKAVKIVRESKNDDEVIKGLKKGFTLDNIQAEYVAEIKLRNFNKDYILNKTKEIKNLKVDIKELKATIRNGIDAKMINDLERVKKAYGIPRKTEIIKDYIIENINIQNIEDSQEYRIFYNNEEIKKLDKDSRATLPEGFIEFNAKGQDEILVFTANTNVYKIKIATYKVMNSIKKISEVIGLEPGNEILFVTPLIDKNIIIVFENGKVAKFPLSAYKTVSNSKCLKNGFFNNVKPIMFKAVDEDEEISLKFSGKIQSFKVSKVSFKTTRTTQGVQILKKRKK